VYAREIDDVSARLRNLHSAEWEHVGLAGFAIAMALAATQLHPPLAVPFMLGGMTSLALGIRALWRHWELVDRMLDDGSTYVIPEICVRAMRETTPSRRHVLAESVRSYIENPAPFLEDRTLRVRKELEELARELDDERLAIDPPSAVACWRLVTDGGRSPLLNPTIPEDELRPRVLQVRSGFRPRSLAA
jgi:hypothetical protein